MANKPAVPLEELTPEQIAAILKRNQELEAQAAEAQTQVKQLEDEKAQIIAKRAAAEQEAENDAQVIDWEKREAEATNAALAKEPLVSVFLSKDPRDKRAVATETVQINGGAHYVIKRDEDQQVPESIYLMLVCAGMVRPQRQKDMHLFPRQSLKPGQAAGII